MNFSLLNRFTILLITINLSLFSIAEIIAQTTCECSYPVILIHGWTNSSDDWDSFVNNNDVNNIFGNFDSDDHVFWVMPNATDTNNYGPGCCPLDPFCITTCQDVLDETTLNDNISGPDGVFNNTPTDDDVQWVFPNEDNVLLPGCLYAYSFSVGKNNDGTIYKNPTLTDISPCDNCSDNNESAITKQGYALKRTIEAVLAANPGKNKVVLVGHSMGGLAAREYLQRTDNVNNPRWWIDPNHPEGHKVAKLVTLGSPHRGSNTLGNFLTSDPSNLQRSNSNIVPNFSSCAIRDLRYSYEDGTLGADIPGVYLYGGLESNIPGIPVDFHNLDVNCDGDKNDFVTGINISGIDQGASDIWDGTTFNPIMPLPDNIKYTYYVSSLDGLVDDQRAWLFMNGSGTSGDYNNGNSVSVPHDGVDHRLSDRFNLIRTHGNHTNDVQKIARMIDEGDYPMFAFEADPDLWYFGLAQERAVIVPNDSEYTLSGDSRVDSDWFFVELMDTSYQLEITLIPHPNIAGRIDFYSAFPGDYNNTSTPSNTLSWNAGTTSNQVITSFVDNYLPGKYYFRISHDLNNSTISVDDSWKTPYKFIINQVEECVNNLYIPGNQDTAHFKVNNKITSDATIISGHTIDYQSGNCIDLLPGFETKPTVNFHAFIKSCSSF